jgi:hypothetical protein
MVHIAEQNAQIAPVDDQSDVAADSHRPEVLVLCLVEFVKSHSGTGRVKLQVKGGRLDGLLFFAGQFGEAVSEGIGNKEFHHFPCPPTE